MTGSSRSLLTAPGEGGGAIAGGGASAPSTPVADAVAAPSVALRQALPEEARRGKLPVLRRS